MTDERLTAKYDKNYVVKWVGGISTARFNWKPDLVKDIIAYGDQRAAEARREIIYTHCCNHDREQYYDIYSFCRLCAKVITRTAKDSIKAEARKEVAVDAANLISNVIRILRRKSAMNEESELLLSRTVSMIREMEHEAEDLEEEE